MYIKGRLIFFFVMFVIALCSVLILLIIKISVWKDEPFHFSDAKEIECLGSCEIKNTNQKIHFFSIKENLFEEKGDIAGILNEDEQKVADKSIFIVILDDEKGIANEE
ncbi:hypothetical protein FNE77_11430 [Listeria monocytogenes]|uniref:nucleomodulin OrfX n=1 Tax=Listeria monocytogenes TaxID=1639 RepID=UPI000E74D80A|nr:DUF5502 family protein [Listeria monocytogenes]EAC4839249.1 hypothetical protein [Listeria monocytogenes]EAC7308399.1 hypothetical protein [Listeria monocytogenes]EAD2640392.1 hypothetical protein [Listeria monocytogenes]EAE6915361.1 hypothetical protein [Listeria monocytogenes]EAF5294273.1 hypothetical protein [Listeria monocytogenes]